MKLDVSEPLRNFKNQPVVEAGEDVSIGDVLLQTCQMFGPQEQPDGAAKMKAFRICSKVAVAEGYVELDESDVKFLKERAGIAPITPLAYGRLCDALDLAQAEAVKAAQAEAEANAQPKDDDEVPPAVNAPNLADLPPQPERTTAQHGDTLVTKTASVIPE